MNYKPPPAEGKETIFLGLGAGGPKNLYNNTLTSGKSAQIVDLLKLKIIVNLGKNKDILSRL